MANNMKIAKEFTWEMGHRLPFHRGKCRNLHGHSYNMRVELNGEPDDTGMLLDYYNLTQIVDEVIEPFDHCFLVEETDKIVRDFLEVYNYKHVVFSMPSTAENMCKHFADKIREKLHKHRNITALTIRVCETPDVYAEHSLNI
jgi:6-pyruvoyltetrahydropterin/6-carboxytetrahydropterin synthase